METGTLFGIIAISCGILFAIPGIVTVWVEYAQHRSRAKAKGYTPECFCSEDYAGYFEAPEGLKIERIPNREDGHRCLSSRAF